MPVFELDTPVMPLGLYIFAEFHGAVVRDLPILRIVQVGEPSLEYLFLSYIKV